VTTRVFIREEGVEGKIISQMLYGAMVSYEVGGIHHEVFMSSEDYDELDEIIEYEEIE